MNQEYLPAPYSPIHCCVGSERGVQNSWGAKEHGVKTTDLAQLLVVYVGKQPRELKQPSGSKAVLADSGLFI